MIITIGSLKFNTIKALTEYLQATYEHADAGSRTVRLEINYDARDKQSNNELIAFLMQSGKSVVYDLKLAPQPFSPAQKAFSQLLDNIYLFNKKQQFTFDFKEQLIEFSKTAHHIAPETNKIRKAKKNWIEGTKSGGIGLQIQQQQQQQQQQQKTVKANKRRQRPKDTNDTVQRFALAEAGELGNLVSLDSIKNDFAQQKFPANTPDLVTIWNNLLGANNEKIEQSGFKITFVQRKAMEQIILHYPEFSFGLVLDNLPAGFYLQQIKDDKLVLCFSDAPQYQHREQITPLTISLQSPVVDEPVGSHQQFIINFIKHHQPDASLDFIESVLNGANKEFLKRFPDLALFEQKFAQLTASDTSPANRKQAFHFFIAQLTGITSPRFKVINELLAVLPLQDHDYRGLVAVLTHAGPEGVLLLAKQFKALHDKELFAELSTIFLADTNGYVSLLTPENFDHLKKLANFNTEQKNWWSALTSQHKASGARTDFNELFVAYEHFLNQMDKMKLKLPLSCPLEPISHMKPALDRLLFILDKASDKEEQLLCLDGLDYGMNGAAYAVRYNNYQLVSREMALTPDEKQKAHTYSIPDNPQLLFKRFSLGTESEAITNFYRYIGTQDWAFSFDAYQRIEQVLAKKPYINELTKTQLLYAIALSTTGRRACNKIDDPYTSFVAFYNKFEAELMKMSGGDPRYFTNYGMVLVAGFNQISNCSPDSMPTLNELSQLLDVVNLTKSSNPDAQFEIASLLTLTLSLISDYNDAGASFIENYKRRVISEGLNSSTVKKFPLDHMLRHLLNNDRVTDAFDRIFKGDATASRNSFILLLSLIDQEVEPVSDAKGTFEIATIRLAEDLSTLLPEDRKIVLGILTDINIEGSFALPTVVQLQQLVAQIKTDTNTLSALSLSDRTLHILNLVNQYMPNTRVGNEPINESANNVFEQIKTVVNELNIDAQLKKAPDFLKSMVASWLNAHKHVVTALNSSPLRPEEVLTALNKEDEQVSSLLGSVQFNLLLKANGAVAKKSLADMLGIDLQTVETFIERKSLIVLLQHRLETAFKTRLAASVKSLQSASPEFDTFVMGFIAKIDTAKTIDTALNEYSQNFERVNSLMNTLIRIKNTNNNEFRLCIKTISREINVAQTRENKNTVLSIEEITDLLETLGKPDYEAVSRPLTTLFQALQEHQALSGQHHEKALEQVRYLSQYRSTLDPDAYNTLLRLSFIHNLANQSVFPIQELVSLQRLQNVDPDQSQALFDTMIHVVKNVKPDVKDYLLKEVIDKTTSIIKEKVKEIPEIVPLLSLLLETCKNSSAEELTRYYSLVNRLETTDSQVLKSWVKILTALGQESTPENVTLLLNVQAGLERHNILLPALVTLFNYPPYPKLEYFVKQLDKSSIDLRTYINAFDNDPKAARAPKYTRNQALVKSTADILKDQFDTSQLSRVVAEMHDLVEDGSLSSELQYDLAQQVIYINALGKDYPFNVAGKTYKNLSTLSRADLKGLSDALIAEVRHSNHSEKDRLKAQLKLFAVIREQYFRATGLFPYSTQILSVLMSLHTQDQNLLMEINTGEGKSITTALLAAMQWVIADGGNVDVCTANRGLVIQDYHDKGAKHFFASLDIPSSTVRADSDAGTYKVGGINYSTIADLALYRSRAKVEHENLLPAKNGVTRSSNLILDEEDSSTLDDRTLFNYSLNSEGGDGLDNPFAWVYPLVNQFIQQKEFKAINSAVGEVWSEDRDTRELKIFLDKHAPTGPDKQRLKELPEKKFNDWINAACIAQGLKPGEDFTIPESNTAIHQAVPFNMKVPQYGSSFSKGVQQFLHARLQKEYPGKEFPIEPEMMFVDSVSAKDIIDFYKEHGHMVFISGTVGTKQEIIEQRGKFDMGAVYRMPSHKKNQREDLGISIAKDTVEHVKKIVKAINERRDNQPIILIGKDANHVKQLQVELEKQLKGKNIKIGAFTGEESEEARQKWVKESAGHADTITIATSLLGRGTDFDTDHASGFLAIQAYLDNARITRQILGRVARNGKLGQFMAVYENHGLIYSLDWFFKTDADKLKIIDAIDKIQRTRSEEAAVERYFIQSVSGMQQVVLKQFDEWQALLRLSYPESELRQLNADLLVQREDLIISLNEAWAKCLEHSDPQKRYPNPYVRRDMNEQLQTGALNEALKEFEASMISIWGRKRELLKTKADSKLTAGSTNALRAKFLHAVELKEQLQLSKLDVRQNKRAQAKERKKSERYLESALDINGAMINYGDGDISQYRQPFADSQFGLLKRDVMREINNSSLKSGAKRELLIELKEAKNYHALEDVLLDYNKKWENSSHFAEKFRMQPVIAELIRVHQMAGLKEHQELTQLKEIYVENTRFDIVENLERSLSWAKPENRGLGYWLERTAVKHAANEILEAVAAVKNSKNQDIAVQQNAIKNLYRVLAQNQAQLSDLWIFSFGHKNTRNLINDTLTTLNGLAALGSSEELNAEFVRECKEDAYFTLMKNDFESVLKELERKYKSLPNSPHWDALKKQLHSMQKRNNSVYVLNEMYYFLYKEVNTNLKGSELYGPVRELRKSIYLLWDTFNLKHHDVLNKSRHYEIKAEAIKGLLSGIDGFAATAVRLKAGHTGFSDYVDLVIEGAGDIPLVDGFIRYNSQLPALEKENSELKVALAGKKTELLGLERLHLQQMPLLRLNGGEKADVSLFPASLQGGVGYILVLKDLYTTGMAETVDTLPEKIQKILADKDNIKSLELLTLTQEQIEKVGDQQLQSELRELYSKVHPPVAESVSFFSRLIGAITSPFVSKESIEDWHYHFAELKSRVSNQLERAIAEEITNQSKKLDTKLSEMQSKLAQDISVLNEQIHFVDDKIKEEHAQSGVMIKRFANLGELYDFEQQVQRYQEAHPKQVTAVTVDPVPAPQAPAIEQDDDIHVKIKM